MSAIIHIKLRYAHPLRMGETALNFRPLTACCELIISLLSHLRESLGYGVMGKTMFFLVAL